MEKIKQNDAFDVLKATMAIMIMVIHIVALNRLGILGTYIFPILRIAVPIFFLISSYLFFKKIKLIGRYGEQKKYLNKTVNRNLMLYLSWFILLSPITFYIRNYFSHGILYGVITILWNFVFGSTFIASWYISALVIGLTIIFYASHFFSEKVIFWCSVICFFFCVLVSNYGELGVVQNLIWKNLRSLPILWTPHNSFPAGLFWIVTGKMFAEKDNFFWFGKDKQKYILLFSLIALYFEQGIINFLHSSFTNDFYFMLMPTCLALFAWVLHVNIDVKNAKTLRAFSTITYCLHASFAKIPALVLLYLGLSKSTFAMSLVKFVITLVFCVIITEIILHLEKYKGWKWLKYLH